MSQTATFTPVADTWLDGDSFLGMLVNYGGSSQLRCSYRRAILFRFCVAGIPAGSTVDSVTLDVVKNGACNSGTNYLRGMYSKNWTEYGATWGMAVHYQVNWVIPFIRETWDTGFSNKDYYGVNISTLVSDSSASDGTTFTFVSTGEFVALLQGCVGTTKYLDLCVPIGCGFRCYSRSTAYPPKLEVAYTLPAPVVSSFDPTSTTSSGTTVTVYGQNFGLDSGMLDSIALVNQGAGSDYNLDNLVWTSAQQVAGDVPASAVPGTYKLRVTIDGQSADSQQTFSFVSTGPSISAVSPASAKPSRPAAITIDGAYFDLPISEVTLIGQQNQGQRAVASFTRVSTSQITATTPAGLPVGQYRIRVTADGEQAVSDSLFSSVLGLVVW